MSASFLISVLVVAPSKRASVRFVPANHTSTPDYLRRNQVRLTTADRSAGRLERGCLSESQEEVSEVLLTAPATLFTDLLIAFFASPTAFWGVTLNLLRGSLSLQPLGTD
jgi:hypothetical protein